MTKSGDYNDNPDDERNGDISPTDDEELLSPRSGSLSSLERPSLGRRTYIEEPVRGHVEKKLLQKKGGY